MVKVKAASTASTASKTPATQPLKETQNIPSQSKHSTDEEPSLPRETLFSPNKSRDIIEANRSRANVAPLYVDTFSVQQNSSGTVSKSKQKYLPDTIRTSSNKSIPSTATTHKTATQVKENHSKNYSENKRNPASSTKKTASDAAKSMQYATKSLNELTSKLTKPCSVKLVRLTDAQLSGHELQTTKDKKSKVSTHSTTSRKKTQEMGFMNGFMSFISNTKTSESKSNQKSPEKSSTDSRMATSTPILSGKTSGKLQHTSDWLRKRQTKIQTPPYEPVSNAATKSFQAVVTKSTSLPAKMTPSTSHTSITAAPSATTAGTLQVLPLPALPWLKILEAKKHSLSMKSTPPSVLTRSTPTSVNAAKSTPQSVGRDSINQSSVSSASSASPAGKKSTPQLSKSQLRPIPSPQWLRHVLLTPKPPQSPNRSIDLSDDE